MNTLSLEQLNQLWGMFPGKAYHLGVSYIVTPLRIRSSRVVETHRVITKEDNYRQLIDRKGK